MNCKKCNIEKPEGDFYRHSQTGKPRSICKVCTYQNQRTRIDRNKSIPGWWENELAKHRQYYKNEKPRKRTAQNSTKAGRAIRAKFPEKYEALKRSSMVPLKNPSLQRHHWSYCPEHYIDIIEIARQDHKKAHRFMIYDQERMMYRRCDNLELLDTKEKHEAYIYERIANGPD